MEPQPLTFFREAFEAAPVGMLVVDASGLIVDANRQLERLFGYPRDALVGQPIELLVDGVPEAHRRRREQYQLSPETRPMGAGRDLFGRHREGHRVPVEIGLTPLRMRNEHFVVASIVDLTERRNAREALQASLAEKDVLLRELHHRAKNNLQLIASLLDLSSGQPSADALAQCQSRVQAISLVHERLYQSGTFTRIDMKEYVEAIAPQLAQAWGAGRAIGLSLETEQVHLGLDAAIPCGLVINELVTNAFKHAFPQGRAGTITVQVRGDGPRVSVAVCDDGVGFDAVAKRPGHIGLELLNALTRQLRGTLTFAQGQGSAVTLNFDRGS